MVFIRPKIRTRLNYCSASGKWERPVPLTESDKPLDTDSFVGQILSNTEVKKYEFKLQPILNFEFYFTACLKQVEERYTRAVSNLKNLRKNELPINRAVDELGNALILMENEKVRLEKLKEVLNKEPVKNNDKEELPNVSFNSIVELKKPLATLHKKYYSNGICPPLEIKIYAYNLLCFPEWYLLKMVESYKNKKKIKRDMEKLIVDVFTKYDKKKPSKSKPKSKLQKIANKNKLI